MISPDELARLKQTLLLQRTILPSLSAMARSVLDLDAPSNSTDGLTISVGVGTVLAVSEIFDVLPRLLEAVERVQKGESG